MNHANKIIVALDTPRLDQVARITTELEGLGVSYKIGFELFTSKGWQAIEQVQKTGSKIFLDLKLHDIPNTIAKTVAVIAEHGLWMFNVHCLGGGEMMRRTREVIEKCTPSGQAKPLAVGVTILTSHDEKQLREDLGIPRGVEASVSALANLAKNSGLDGVVCSAQEAARLRSDLGKDFLLVTPGIRPEGSDKNDQSRVMTPEKALQAGASHLVIGRPITAARDPRKATENILQTLT